MLPKTGDVIDYPYIWRWQRDNEETEGRKLRPVCVAVALNQNSSTYLALLSISTKSPRTGQTAIEIPKSELLRVGLSHIRGEWIYVDEYNFDISEKSFYLKPLQNEAKSFSVDFIRRVLLAFRPTLTRKSNRINRTV